MLRCEDACNASLRCNTLYFICFFMPFATKRAFTMVELIVVVFVISVGILGLVYGLSKGYDYVQSTRQKIIAINLSREGMEAIYNIRDTNRSNWWNSREACWLKIDPLNDWGDRDCSNDDWMQSGSYILLQTWDSQRYFILSGVSSAWDFEDWIDNQDFAFSLCQIGGVWAACPGSNPLSREGTFFRQIKGKGLFRKDVIEVWWTELVCQNGDAQWESCGDDGAKEFRFCSEVGYIAWSNKWSIELCGVLTNFW